MPDDDVAAARYEMIDSALTAAGMPWYELSNWAKPGGQCQHNIGYWRNHDWWGVGPGAHSHVGGVRWWNQKHPATWARAVVAGDAAGLMAGSEVPDAAAVALETVMLGVRMREGLPLHSLDSTAQAALTDLVARGLIEPLALIDPLVVLTLAGRLMADAVVRELTA
jgi:oxygen-independent coproporphyrinogen-3 oxidase